MRILLLFCLLTGALFAESDARKNFDWDVVEKWAIQDRGRLKPFNTFAEETLLFVTGKRGWKAKDGTKVPATETLFSWLFRFDLDWEEVEFIRVAYEPVKKELDLDVKRNFFSPKELRANQGLRKKFREIMAKEQQKERLTELEKKIVQVENQRLVPDAIMSGQAMTFLPNPKGINESWFPISALTESGGVPYDPQAASRFSVELKGMMDGYLANEPMAFNGAVGRMTTILREDLAKGAYPSERMLSLERSYNQLRPFRWSWVFYTLAFVFFTMAMVGKGGVFSKLGGASLVFGFLLHTYGFALRCIIAGRPPVTNMYESVIWVTWGCILFSFVIWLLYRKLMILTAATVFAVLGLILADNLPAILDASIHPLEPVLRSNLWLTIHVLTITLSYAAFALSLCLGNVVLGNYFYRPDNTAVIQQYSLYMYRAMQIGVVLLAAGTILGGVWADYSWGRFWGWDPKEVWALIALLLYLAVLHGRFTGWLKGFGFVVTTVISFLGVLMAWYGVNFVLGVGLHSYGFGSGGMSYVAGYVLLQLAFIGAAYSRYSKSEAKQKNVPILPSR